MLRKIYLLSTKIIVGDDAYIVPKNRLTKIGLVCEKYIHNINIKYESVSFDKYVIMPNHIHILISYKTSAGASPCPTISDIICTFKSITTRFCKKAGLNKKHLFQSSFHDHNIRGKNDYQKSG